MAGLGISMKSSFLSNFLEYVKKSKYVKIQDAETVPVFMGKIK